jgi:low affinity Fe/Cu permease
MKSRFDHLAAAVAKAVGSPYTFFGALAIVIAWLLAGPVFQFSNTWQLFINTTTTVVTNLIVFLIQNTENRDSKAVHLKLDEIIASIPKASNTFTDIENLSEKELKELHRKLQKRIKK